MDERDIPIILMQTIRMKALVPVIRSFERAFGKEPVHAVLRELVQSEKDDARSSAGRDPDFDRAAKAMGRFAADDALDYKIIAKDADRLDIDVGRCKYAELMKELNAVDLGHLLICEGDFAPALRAGMELTRTQTRMQGASHCDFRFKRPRGLLTYVLGHLKNMPLLEATSSMRSSGLSINDASLATCKSLDFGIRCA